MKDSLCLHNKDRAALKKLSQMSDRGVLLIGDRGLGKKTVAAALARSITGHAYLMSITEPDSKASITIDQIRSLKKFFELKGSGINDKLVGVIVDADLMTTEAQNALLKLLEEPPKNAHLILTSSRESGLLTTILSRTIVHRMTKPPLSELSKHLSMSGKPYAQSLKLSGGLPGVAFAMLQDESDDMVRAIESAKEFLSSPLSARLKYVDVVSKDKVGLANFVDGLSVVISTVLENHMKNSTNAGKWSGLASELVVAKDRLNNNISPKLVLSKLALSL